MLKYLYCKEVFREIPSEISLGVSLTGCTIHCDGCHSKELWEDSGTPLDVEELGRLLGKHRGITCLLLLGGEHDIASLVSLFKYARGQGIKTAWYCGLTLIPPGDLGILECLDYVKIGPYVSKLGGLESPRTNQRLYQVRHFDDGSIQRIDITSKVWIKKLKQLS